MKNALKRERFLILLFAFLLLLLIYPLFPKDGFGVHLLDFFLLFLCLTGINAISAKKRILVCALLLILLAIVAEHIIDRFTTAEIDEGDLEWVKLAVFLKPIVAIFFFLTISISILCFVLKSDRITREKLAAALCVYLFLALTWAYAYTLLELVSPGSIDFGRTYDIEHNPVEYLSISRFMYFSFVTLTTLGYGDICPVSPMARNLAILEAIVGQFYMAILMARLVALYITQPAKKE